MLEINFTTVVCRGLFSAGYLYTHVTWILLIKKYPYKFFWNVFINLDSDFGRSCRTLAMAALIRLLVHSLDKFILSMLWERKTLPTSTVTCSPLLLTLEVS